MSKTPILLVVSDIHLSHKPPLARAEKGEQWYFAMDWVLTQLRRLCLQYGCPLVISGDLFHTWKEPAELINFVMGGFPEVTYAVPGQHDTPNHCYANLAKSCYWTLYQARSIQNIVGKVIPSFYKSLILHGFPWSFPITPRKGIQVNKEVHVAVVHDYIWTDGKGYVGANDNKKVINRKKEFESYDWIISGDNHQHFRNMNVWNCGCLIRRRSDERSYQPCVGLLYDDATIERVPLDCSEDKWEEPEKVLRASGIPEGLRKEFLSELNKMGSDPLDFRAAVLRVLDNGYKATEGQRKLVLDALEMGV